MRRLLLLACLIPCQALALDIGLPGGVLSGESESPADSVRLPEAPWSAGTLPPQREGMVRKRAYTAANPSRTTLQLIDPARQALTEAGYEEVFSCADAACGGFDFRFQLDLLPEPEMHVDLGDYRYLLMTREGASPSHVSLVASSSASAGFLHVTELYPPTLPDKVPDTGPNDMPATRVPDLASSLVEFGHVVLDDLDFGTGSAELGPGPYSSLESLAAWLAENPAARVLLVGHTDAVGSQDANAALSQRRAQSVASRMIEGLGADPAQIVAEGAGYLSPVASNLTEDGRAANRRVEAVLLSR